MAATNLSDRGHERFKGKDRRLIIALGEGANTSAQFDHKLARRELAAVAALPAASARLPEFSPALAPPLAPARSAAALGSVLPHPCTASLPSTTALPRSLRRFSRGTYPRSRTSSPLRRFCCHIRIGPIANNVSHLANNACPPYRIRCRMPSRRIPKDESSSATAATIAFRFSTRTETFSKKWKQFGPPERHVHRSQRQLIRGRQPVGREE